MGKAWRANALTGGAAGSLDALDGSLLADGDIAIVMASGRAYLYELDHDNSSAEASPWIVCPDKNYGTKRWVLHPTDFHNATLARAYLGGNITTFTHATEEQITLDQEEIDVGGNFGSNKYTAPVTGYYHLDWSAYAAPGAQTPSALITNVKKNGATLCYGTLAAATNGYVISNGSVMKYLIAGQYVELWATAYTVAASGDCTIIWGSHCTFLSVYLISL